ncbi:MAG: site-specific integrase [Verrucomicrobia bacterium]|nr:site-specific integrase [Verrucomicrobiota bacterium]
MPSIKQRPGSPYWICCYRKSNGERTQRSTKEKDKNKAWVVCLAWAEAERKAGKGILTEAQARRVISEIVERTTGEPLHFYTVEDWLRDWLAGKKQTRSQGTGESYGYVVDRFIKHLGKRAALNIAHISSRDVKSFRDAEIHAGKSGRTCNRGVSVIRTAFNAARRQGLITENPAEALDDLGHKAVKKEVFTAEQTAALLGAAPSQDWRGVILFAYFTGARLWDVANMKWTSIDLSAKTIRFTPRKTARTGKEIVIPLHPDLEAHLLTIAGQDNPEAFLFSTLAGRKTGGSQGLSTPFSRIMEKAGIAAGASGPRKGTRGRTFSKLSFHSFRHGFNSAMLNRGVSQEIRQLLTGHASAEMNKNYSHHELEPLRAAVSVIPSVTVK